MTYIYECFNNSNKKYLFNYDKIFNSNNINMTDNSNNSKFDSSSFNKQIEELIKKKKEERLKKNEKYLTELKNKDIEENIIREEDIYRTSYLYHFNKWLFSIPKLILNIFTFNLFHLLKNDDILLYLGIWLIVIGIIVYLFIDVIFNNNINLIGETYISSSNFPSNFNPNLNQNYYPLNQ